ncbi:hypothetical protein MPER_08263 [Moniliophthora perniciosa FA553]|nr:hypothetical protein MPER_08263 [Moniliophthora perniciosa FA553]
MCLYGNDLDETTSPVEAGLTWVIGKERRETGEFIGADGVRKHLKEGPPRRRVGFTIEGAPARQGAKIFAGDEQVGEITSGIPSPTLNKNIAMGYIKNGLHKKGTEVEVEVRNKRRKAIYTLITIHAGGVQLAPQGSKTVATEKCKWFNGDKRRLHGGGGSNKYSEELELDDSIAPREFGVVWLDSFAVLV